MGLWAKTMAIVWKDVRVEFRSKEMLSAVLIFSFLVVLVFSFAFDPMQHDLSEVFPGILWVAFFFAGTLGLNRSFVSEKQNDTLQGLILAPGDRGAIFLGKFLGNWLFMMVAVLLLTPVFFAFLNEPLRGGVMLAAILVLGTIGFTAAGTFLSGLAVNTRASEVLLPILLFPLLVPVIIAAVRATQGLWGNAPALTLFWMKVLIGYDLIFIAVPLVVFEYLLES